MISAVDVSIMRAGTSKGVFLRLDDLPAKESQRLKLLEVLLGTDTLQIDGLGGGHTLTSKIALVAKSKEPGIDIDYHFIQVVPGRSIMSEISCGNMMSAVGPYAIESGIVKADAKETKVTVRDVNNGSKAELIVKTPNHQVTYSGDVEIAGCKGTSAPIMLSYSDLLDDPKQLFPSGNVVDRIDGYRITYVKFVVPLLIFKASELGLQFDECDIRRIHDRHLIEKCLDVRDHFVAKLDGKPNRQSVSPKIAIVDKPYDNGNISTRYFTPHTPHRSVAVTGAITILAASCVTGTIARECWVGDDSSTNKTHKVSLEHVSGALNLHVDYAKRGKFIIPDKVGLLRTARMLMQGKAYLPDGIEL